MVPVRLTASARDAVTAAPAVSITSVACNEHAPDDCQITGPMTLNLRAERTGAGEGRVYTITVEARDAAGNASSQSVQVLVSHDQGKS